MDDELTRNYRRWRSAEEEGRDEEAETAFAAVFAAAVDEQSVSQGFALSTMAAVAATAERDARRARRARLALIWIGVVGGVFAAYFSAGLFVSLASTIVTGAIDLLIRVIVGASAGAQTGGGLWSVASSLGRATAAFAANPVVTFTILAIQAVAVAALIALQRLLGSDWESYK
jgi:hypothetical protein